MDNHNCDWSEWITSFTRPGFEFRICLDCDEIEWRRSL